MLDFLGEAIEYLERFHLKRIVELSHFELKVGFGTTEAILLNFIFLERLSWEMFGFAIAIHIVGDVKVGFGDCISCFLVSKLIKSKSISIFMVELFRILFVSGNIVAFPKMLATAL